MKLDEHCAQSLTSFGKEYREVHIWLDEFAHSKEYGMRHRRKRHHLAGIEEIRRLWGDEAAKAAKQHIEADLRLEGWNETYPFPKDENDYVQMGLF